MKWTHYAPNVISKRERKMKPRKFQLETDAVCEEILAGAPIKEILFDVTPGGGKSSVPVIIANRLIPKFADKILWLSPRVSLKLQGEEAFLKPMYREWLGSQRTIRADQNGIDPCRGHRGYANTFQGIDDAPELASQELDRYRYILVLDEFHHLEEGGQWHRHIQPLVDKCKLLILMTGALERGDRRRIAFMRYVVASSSEVSGPSYLPDLENNGDRRVIRYSRSRALEDQSILPIEFCHADAAIDFYDHNGDRQVGDSFASFDKEKSRDAVYTALNTNYAMKLLDGCTQAWLSYRKKHPSSQMLLVANCVEKAKDYNKYLNDHYGITSCKYAVNEESKSAQESIADFRHGRLQVINTVQMAYEGMDAPGITHICCLTHIRSKPWIEQMFARGVRIDPKAGPWRSQRCIAYTPDDRLMNEVIDAIRKDQVTTAHDPTEGPPPPPQIPGGPIIPIGSDLTSTRYSELDGQEYSKEECLAALERLEEEGLVGQISVPQFMRMVRNHVNSFPFSECPIGEISTPSEREKILRTNIQRAASLYDRIYNLEPGTMNGKIYVRYGKKRREAMTESELGLVWSWLSSQLSSHLSYETI
jgi:superfamily II DNA or RNA helicase